MLHAYFWISMNTTIKKINKVYMIAPPFYSLRLVQLSVIMPVINILSKALKAHTDTLILFQLEVPLPFKGFAFLRKAPLGLLLPFSGQILIISPHLPHSGLFVLDNRHLSHLLVCGQSVDSFHKILRADTPFYCHKSFSLKLCIQPPYQLISIG